MDKIRCIYTSTVHAPVEDAAPTDFNRRIDLTPFDLRLLISGPIQTGLLFHKPQNDAALIRRLETSLAATLRFFPELAGRLSRTDDETTATFFIDCNNAGAKFVHAAADSVSVSDIADAVFVPEIVVSFFSDIGAVNHGGVSQPLLAAQVTELSDGVFIGCSINNAVVDGASFWHFFISWSEICRGLGTVSKQPLRRWLQGHGPVRIPLEQLQIQYAREGHAPAEWVERIFRFSKESIAELKARANCEMGTDRISSLQALLAHFWRSFLLGRRGLQNDEQDCRLSLAIGARPRLLLPEQYFGNAILGVTVTMKTGDVLGQNRIGEAAWELNKIITWHTQQKFKSFLECWVENPILRRPLDRMTIDDSLVISCSPRFNVYDNDFGWGKPIAVRTGFGNKSPGCITLFPGADENNIEIQACLLPETLHVMEKDLEFMGKDTN